MNPNKAIEILKDMPTDGYDPHDFEQYDAIDLGIEALEALLLMREHSGMSFNSKLPSETEE